MIPLVYPYKATEDDGLELKLSLRGVHRFLHLGQEFRPIVAGETCPGWLPEEFFVEVTGPDLGKVCNINRNILAAIEGLSGDFLYMNDDFILLEPRVDVLRLHGKDWKRFYQDVSIGKLSWFWDSTQITDKFLTMHPEPISWETHHPMWLNADRLRPMMQMLVGRGLAGFHRTIYGNLVGYDEPTYYAHDALSISRALGSSWVSLNEKHSQRAFFKHVRSVLREPSPWEVR